MESGEYGSFVVACPLAEGSQRCLLAGFGLLPHARLGGPQDPVEVGREKGRGVFVIAVKLEQTAVEHDGLEQHRITVGDRFVGLGPPGEKLLQRAEGGRGGLQFEGILGGGEACIGRTCDGDCIANEHVPDRRPPSVGHAALFNESVPLGNWHCLQGTLCGAAWVTEGRVEPSADLGKDRRQIPCSH